MNQKQSKRLFACLAGCTAIIVTLAIVLTCTSCSSLPSSMATEAGAVPEGWVLVETLESDIPGTVWALYDIDGDGVADRKQLEPNKPAALVADVAENTLPWPWNRILGGLIGAGALGLAYFTRKPVGRAIKLAGKGTAATVKGAAKAVMAVVNPLMEPAKPSKKK